MYRAAGHRRRRRRQRSCDALQSNGYSGWYTLEQDTILTGPPADTGVDPRADVGESVAHILAVADDLAVTP